jgi:hypothetical protein
LGHVALPCTDETKSTSTPPCAHETEVDTHVPDTDDHSLSEMYSTMIDDYSETVFFDRHGCVTTTLQHETELCHELGVGSRSIRS